MVSVVFISVSNLLQGKLCSVVNSNKLRVYGKKIVNYATLKSFTLPNWRV